MCSCPAGDTLVVVVLQLAAACERLTARREQLRSSVSRLVGHASNLANSCLSVALPALLAAVIVRKKTGRLPDPGYDLPSQ